MNKITIVLSLVILLSLTSLGGANPGGVGDGDFDMQCGGACHGDASQNQTSPALLELSLDGDAYFGLPVSITASVSGIQFSSSDAIGLFLLTDVTGHSDLPEDGGWEVISDVNGGDNNYVEIEGSSFDEAYTISWTLKPTVLESTIFYLSIHHGGQNTPYFAISSGLNIDVLPVPDNLPRLSSEYSPIISRDLGQQTTMPVFTSDVDELAIEWRLVDRPSNSINATLVDNNSWEFELPPALQPSIIEWRAVMDGDGPTQITPWFRIAAQEPVLEVNQLQVYLQSLAFCIFFLTLILTLQSRYLNNQEDLSMEIDHSSLVTQQENSGVSTPPLPEGELPDGWTMEQWKWYGHEYLEDLK